MAKMLDNASDINRLTYLEPIFFIEAKLLSFQIVVKFFLLYTHKKKTHDKIMCHFLIYLTISKAIGYTVLNLLIAL